MEILKPDLAIGQRVYNNLDTTGDIYTIKGIYFSEGPVQYHISNFKDSGYALESDLSLVSPDGSIILPRVN